MTYTDQKLIDELHRFVRENGRVPKKIDMGNKNGYPSTKAYKEHFGSWNDALKLANYDVNRLYIYSDSDLLEYIHKFVREYNKVPTQSEMDSTKNFPHSNCYINKFGTYNNALKLCGYPVNQINTPITGNEKCSVCGATKTPQWGWNNGHRVCANCKTYNRKFVEGTLDYNSSTGIGYIFEIVTQQALGYVEVCNTIENFHSPSDLFCKKYGSINVKARALSNKNIWQFRVNTQYIPDHFILIALDSDKKSIVHVWAISTNDEIIKNRQTFRVTNSECNLREMSKFELDVAKFNKIYQNINIKELRPFRNLELSSKT